MGMHRNPEHAGKHKMTHEEECVGSLLIPPSWHSRTVGQVWLMVLLGQDRNDENHENDGK